MKGPVFVKVFGYFNQHKDHTVDLDCVTYVQRSTDQFVVLDTTQVYALYHVEELPVMDNFDYDDDGLAADSLHKAFNWMTETRWCNENAKLEANACSFFNSNSPHVCPHLKWFMPLYIFRTPVNPLDQDFKEKEAKWYIVHPDERERMGRVLNGTDNPLYDLVHELRYNPNISSRLGAEREEAQQDFEQVKKRKV
jgi:hypothetical protein